MHGDLCKHLGIDSSTDHPEGRFFILGRSVRVSPRRGGGGGTLIFSYIRRPGLFFGVKNFDFQYFWGFSGK